MKRILTTVLLALAAFSAIAQTTTPTADAWEARTRNPANNGTIIYYIVPDGAVDQLASYSGAANSPTYLKLGAGISRSGTTLTISPSSTQISDSTLMGRTMLTATDASAVRTAIGAAPAGSGFDGQYSSLSGIPSTFPPSAHNQAWTSITSTPTTRAGYGITDALGAADLVPYATSASVTTALSSYATTASLSGYATTGALTTGLAGKYASPTGTTTQYVRGDGSLATLPGATPFNFSQPTARTLAVATSYQALDNTKAAVIVPSYACQNATQVLASSACTVQVRVGTGTLTCSTGTVYYTQSLTVSLGVLLTQNSTNPVPINLPIGGSFILCQVAGTFTISTVEQSAG